MTVQQLEERREEILEQMRDIRSMRRGTVNEQYLKVAVKDRKEPALRGPYYVISRREGKKTVSQRLRSKQEVQQAREDVAQHKRFVSLCKEFEQVTEQLGQLLRSAPEGDREKKRRSLRSRRMPS